MCGLVYVPPSPLLFTPSSPAPHRKEILANELGVVFNNDQGKGRRDAQEGVGGDFDPDLVSTEGTVEVHPY